MAMVVEGVVGEWIPGQIHPGVEWDRIEIFSADNEGSDTVPAFIVFPEADESIDITPDKIEAALPDG